MFAYQNPSFEIIWKGWECEMLVCTKPFGIFYAQLVYNLMIIYVIHDVLSKKNPSSTFYGLMIAWNSVHM
jgi:hypothetical protein